MKYTITHTGTDWLLKIWEPAPVDSARDLPFLYKIKLRFSSEKEALMVLDHYKMLYSGTSHLEISDMGALMAV
ncbi:hypothetical protein HPC62_14550 [Thermoleptolyngbya sichuanensis A183]|uniref:Uncharacterized protein n=1 Tax=Thermoleptolyngbya sichuanensis A183 TaxID=2737172 RepID=A0A6M8B8B4_9CYAN|nr:MULTISPECIES: hypothetical protein [Thermoleptolyngbya]QKD83254.1 hypothetical protein HPC62_14550 [Thermoleptolyngbya sichuanensis A183]